MGWKLSLIGIKTEVMPDFDALATDLGFPDFKEEKPLERALYPATGLGICRWHDILLLSCDSLQYGLMKENNQASLKAVVSALGPGDIYLAGLHSVTNYYAFGFISGGAVVRLAAGCADLGQMLNLGVPFDWESKHQFEEEYDGEGAVFEFLQGLLGFPIDQAPDDFFQATFRVYRRPPLSTKLKRFVNGLFGR